MPCLSMTLPICFQEDSDSRLAIQEALSMMSTAFKNIDESKLKLMEALIMQNIEKVHFGKIILCLCATL